MATLSLSGLYGAAKGAYSTYIPLAASSRLEAVATKVLEIASPFVSRVLPKAAAEKVAVPADLSTLDSLLLSLFAFGDEKIVSFFSGPSTQLAIYRDLFIGKYEGIHTFAVGKYDEAKPLIEAKVEQAKARAEEVKTFVVGKYEEVKPAISAQVKQAKVVVQKTIEDENVQSMLATATPYFNMGVATASPYYQYGVETVELVKENVEPAKTLLSNIAASAKNEITEKGIRAFAFDSAEGIKAQSLEAYSVLNDKGIKAGVKVISVNAYDAIVAALEEAKKDGAAKPIAGAGTDEEHRGPVTGVAVGEVKVPDVSKSPCAETLLAPLAEGAKEAEAEEEKEEYSSADDA